ncbi:MAG: hypothetical protein J7518_04590 [Nocardioidaceae bacterium]|nr:hypothetical protein [Nocardioidaceae bacterium]
MLAQALDGRAVVVRRRWMPWRLRKRKVNPSNPLLAIDVADGVSGLLFSLVFGLVFALVIALFGSVILFGVEAVLLVALLIPLLAALRILWVIPWVVEATNGDTVLGVEKVRGWRDSGDRIREIAEAYQRGEDPFEVRDYAVGT